MRGPCPRRPQLPVSPCLQTQNLLCELTAELQAQHDELEARLAALEARLDALGAALQALPRLIAQALRAPRRRHHHHRRTPARSPQSARPSVASWD